MEPLNLLLFHPAIQIRYDGPDMMWKRRHAGRTRRSGFQRPAAGDNAIGFMQVGERRSEFTLLFETMTIAASNWRAQRESSVILRHGCPAAVGDDLIIQPFRQRIIADVAQENW